MNAQICQLAVRIVAWVQTKFDMFMRWCILQICAGVISGPESLMVSAVAHLGHIHTLNIIYCEVIARDDEVQDWTPHFKLLLNWYGTEDNQLSIDRIKSHFPNAKQLRVFVAGSHHVPTVIDVDSNTIDGVAIDCGLIQF